MATSKKAKTAHARSAKRGAFHPLSNLPGTDLPLGPPSGPKLWQPYEIVLIKWQLSRAGSPVRPYIDTNTGASGVYSNATLVADTQNQYLDNIQKFAIDIASGNVALPIEPLHTTATGTGSCDFVIWYPCYVVFMLEFGYWRFQQGNGTKALRTSYPQSAPTYTDLNHLVGTEPKPSVGRNQCQVAYFSAGSTPNAYNTMPFNLFFDYVPIQPPFDPAPDSFDPTIKNDGHTPPTFYGEKRKRR